MARLANAQEVESEKQKLLSRTEKLQERSRATIGAVATSPLDLLAPHKRAMYGQMFDLIYECSTHRVAAKALVDRILEKISMPNGRDGSRVSARKRSSEAGAVKGKQSRPASARKSGRKLQKGRRKSRSASGAAQQAVR